MPMYVGLFNWTDQGVRAVKDTVKRYEAGTAQGEAMGVKMVHFLWTMGPYDGVAVYEAPNDQAASRFALSVGSQGNVRTLTMRAYTKDEIAGILAGIP